jgi:hypothetical protein
MLKFFIAAAILPACRGSRQESQEYATVYEQTKGNLPATDQQVEIDLSDDKIEEMLPTLAAIYVIDPGIDLEALRGRVESGTDAELSLAFSFREFLARLLRRGADKISPQRNLITNPTRAITSRPTRQIDDPLGYNAVEIPGSSTMPAITVAGEFNTERLIYGINRRPKINGIKENVLIMVPKRNDPLSKPLPTQPNTIATQIESKIEGGKLRRAKGDNENYNYYAVLYR